MAEPVSPSSSLPLRPLAIDTGASSNIGLEPADPPQVARTSFDALMAGEADVVAGLKKKLQAARVAVTPSLVLAEQRRQTAEPGSTEGATS